MKLRYYFLFLIFFFLVFRSFSQEDVEIVKEKFKIKDEGFELAWKNVQKANKLYKKGKTFFASAKPMYDSAFVFNPNCAALCYKLGICCFFSNEPEKASFLLKRAHKLDEKISNDVVFWLGISYKMSQKFDSAQFCFEKYLSEKKDTSSTFSSKYIEKLRGECILAKTMTNNPIRAYIDILGDSVNSVTDDYFPIVNKSDSLLFFTSLRGGLKSGKIPDLSNQEMFFSSKVANKWQPSLVWNKELSINGYDALIEISFSGKMLLCQKWNGNNCDIYYSENKQGKWTSLKAFPSPINTKEFRESFASISSNDSVLYFISDNTSGFGENDIYVSYKDKAGNWKVPENLGNTINTQFDEASVFVSQDGNTLYFSSNGHNTMGGYDIFYSEKNKTSQEWSAPKNIGYPINSIDDDLYFMALPDKKRAYFSSNRRKGKGGKDIYSVYFLGEEFPEIPSSENTSTAWDYKPMYYTTIEPAIETIVMQGEITNSRSGVPVLGKLEVIDPETNKVVITAISDSSSGAYSVNLPSSKKYNIAIKATDYMFLADIIKPDSLLKYQLIKRDYQIFPIDIGVKLILRNIFFDAGKAILRPESSPEIERLITFMKNYPNVKIEISGHTDDKGSPETNTSLSKQRALAVVKYMTEKGIKADRLKAEGYGSKQALASNETEEGRQQNRRVEAKIIGK